MWEKSVIAAFVSAPPHAGSTGEHRRVLVRLGPRRPAGRGASWSARGASRPFWRAEDTGAARRAAATRQGAAGILPRQRSRNAPHDSTDKTCSAGNKSEQENERGGRHGGQIVEMPSTDLARRSLARWPSDVAGRHPGMCRPRRSSLSDVPSSGTASPEERRSNAVSAFGHPASKRGRICAVHSSTLVQCRPGCRGERTSACVFPQSIALRFPLCQLKCKRRVQSLG